MIKFIAALQIFTMLYSSAFAGFPPTTSKVSGDSSDLTTFKYQFPNFTGTHTGTTLSLGVNSIAGGGTGQASAASAMSALSPITTTGDMIYSSSGTTNSRLAAGTANQLLMMSGGVPTWSSSGVYGNTTDPVAETRLTYNGLASVSAINAFSYRNGKFFCAYGNFTTGVGSASPAAVILPSGIVIDSTVLSATTMGKDLGKFFPSTGGTNQIYAASVGGVFFYDGSTTDRLFMTTNFSATPAFAKVNGNSLTFTNPLSFDFCVPVVGYSSSGLATNIVSSTNTANHIEYISFGGAAGSMTSRTKCTSTPCTIYKTSIAGASVTRASAGTYSVIMPGGTFSDNFVCTGSGAIQVGTVNVFMSVPSSSSDSATEYDFGEFTGAGTAVDSSGDLICMGPR